MQRFRLARWISVSSAKHADPQMATCSLAGRNIVSRSVSSNVAGGVGLCVRFVFVQAGMVLPSGFGSS